MNVKLLIRDLNRKRVPFCELKKYLAIEDDIKLMNILLDVTEIGINSLSCTIVLKDFMYIIYSLQYLKIIGKDSEDARVKITPFIHDWIGRVESMCKVKKTKQIKSYALFLSDILGELQCVLSLYKEIETPKIKPKHLTFEATIYEMIRKADDIDIQKVTMIVNEYIIQYLSMGDEKKQYESLRRMIHTLRNKRSMYKEQKEEIIQRILSILESYYSPYHASMVQDFTNLFGKYVGTYTIGESNAFESWEVNPLLEHEQPFVITIDNSYSLDLDDALSIAKGKYGKTLHIYIADTTPFLLANPMYETIAFEKYSSLYFSQYNSQVAFHMLPQVCAEDLLSLRENEWRNVIDHAFYIDDFGNISYEISYHCIEIHKHLSYDEVNKMISKKSDSEMKEYLCALEHYIQIIYKKMGLYKNYKLYSQNRVEQLVSMAMLLVNYMTATNASNKQYLLLYQDYYSGKYSIHPTENLYTKVTSPIRRYSDLKNNYLLRRFLENNISDSEYVIIEHELQDMLPVLESKKQRNKYFSKMLPSYLNYKI